MRGRVGFILCLGLLPFAGTAQPYEQLFSVTDATISVDRLASDGVRNTYFAGREGGQLLVRKLDEFGDEVWSTIIPDTGNTKVTQILLDANQDIYVGSVFGTTDKFAMVVSLRRTDGSVRWISNFDCGDKNDAISDIAVAKVGNSVLLYQLTNTRVSPTNDDVLARRLNPATGAEIWRRQLGGALDDKPIQLASNTAGAPFLAATIDGNKPTVFRLSGTDGSTVFNHVQTAIPGLNGAARGLTVLSDGRLGFLFDGASGGAAVGGAEILNATNGALVKGHVKSSSASIGTALWVSIAPTRHGTMVSWFRSGLDFAVFDIGDANLDIPLISSPDVGTSVAVDLGDQVQATAAGAIPKLRRAPATAEQAVISSVTDIDVDNKDQVTMAANNTVVKLRQRAAALNDAFVRPLPGGVMTVAAPGVLRNDGGLNGATVTVVQNTTKGTLVLNTDGSFTYTAGQTFIGTDSFQYRVTNNGVSSTATVSLRELKISDHTISETFGGDTVIGDVVFNFRPDADLPFEVTDNSSAVTSPPIEPMGFIKVGTTRKYALASIPVSAQFTVTVTAKIQNLQSTVTFALKPGGLKELLASKTSFISGETVIGIIKLTGPRSAQVAVTSSAQSVIVPDLVPVSGPTNGFFIESQRAFISKVVIITATLGSVTKTLSLQVDAMPRVINITGFPNVVGGASFQGGVDINKTTPYDLDVALSRAPSNAPMTIPATATVPKGQTFKSFQAPTTAVTADKTVTITASAGGATVTKTVKVIRNPLQSITITPTTIIGGNAATGTVHFNNLAPAEGIQVTLQKTATDLDVPQTVRVLGGAWSVDFSVLTKPVSSNSTRTIFALLGTVQKSVTFTVVP